MILNNTMIFSSPIDKKIKICFVSHFGYPLYNKKCKESFGGGAEVQLYLLSKELAIYEELEIFVLTGNFGNKKERFEIYKNIKLVKVLPLKRTIFNIFRGIFNFFITLIRINPDIVIQRTGGILTGFSALYCKLFRKKFIFSIASKADVNGDLEKRFLGKIFKFGINNASYLVAQNKEQISELEGYKKRKFVNIVKINSGHEIIKPGKRPRRNILWIGRVDHLKRPEIFLKLARHFKQEKFVMICNLYNDEEKWEEINREAMKISNLKFYKYMNFHKIGKYFSGAKMLINTSIYEGFPNTFIQAFINKTPIISLNVNPDKILTERNVGLYCAGDFNKLIKKIDLLLKDESLNVKLSTNGFKYVKENHNIQMVGSKWVKIIKKIP